MTILSAQKLSRLIDDIYSTTTEPQRWPEVLEQIARVLSSGTATLLIHNFSNGTFPLVMATQGFPEEVTAAYREHFGAIDVLRDRSMTLANGELATEDQLAPSSGLARCEVYRDLYVRWGMGHILGGYVAKEQRFGAVLAVHRPLTMHDYGFDELNTSELIVPHVGRAIRIQHLLSLGTGVCMAGMDALSRACIGVAVVERSGRVLNMNERADDIVAAGGTLQIRDGKFALRRPGDRAALHAAIANAASRSDGKIKERGEILSVDRGVSSRPLLIAVTSAPSQLPGCAVVLLIDSNLLPSIPADLLRRVHGLSPAECRVAVLLCQGRSVAAIADETQTTRGTVRTHVKRILAKTGTSRQTELVSLLLRGVMRMNVSGSTP